MMLARLKNPTPPNRLKQFGYASMLFQAGGGFREVTDEQAEHLRRVGLDGRETEATDLASHAFDVYTFDEAMAVLEQEGDSVERYRESKHLIGKGAGPRQGTPNEWAPSARDAIYGRTARPGFFRDRGAPSTAPNVDERQNHWRTTGGSATDRDPRETHATDPNPPPGQGTAEAGTGGASGTPAGATSLGTPQGGQTATQGGDGASAPAKTKTPR